MGQLHENHPIRENNYKHKPRARRTQAPAPPAQNEIPGIRVIRGQYMEAVVVKAKSIKPQIIVKYGPGEDYLYTSFDQAAAVGRQMLVMDKLVNALRAVQEFNNGDRDDFEQVADQVDAALNILTN